MRRLGLTPQHQYEADQLLRDNAERLCGRRLWQTWTTPQELYEIDRASAEQPVTPASERSLVD